MILGYLAYVIVFIFGLMVGCALAAHKIEALHQHIEQLQSAIARLAGLNR